PHLTCETTPPFENSDAVIFSDRCRCSPPHTLLPPQIVPLDPPYLGDLQSPSFRRVPPTPLQPSGRPCPRRPGLLNNNNLPFLTGLGGTTASVFNNNGNNGNNIGVGFSIGNDNQLPEGMTLEKLMVGTMTVFDDELTEGEELGSDLVGKAQEFYVASSFHGTSQLVMAFPAKFGMVIYLC
ncbi:hypothetical protein HN51_046948, partial [Arachis hypogaea]